MEYFSYVFKISYGDYTCVLISGNLLNNLSDIILNIDLTTLNNWFEPNKISLKTKKM